MFSFNVKILSSFFLAEFLIIAVDKINENLPSRSAKLRYAIKKTDFYDFKTDVLEKFSNLIEIENFGNKL